MENISLLSDPGTDEFRNRLREFRLLPTDLDSVAMAPNLSVHTSESIKRLVIDWIYKHPTTKNIAPKLEELIRNNTIIIGYMDKSKIGFIYRKFKRWLVSKPYTLGFYSSQMNKIVIVLDDNVTMFGKSITHIPSILVHELIHMVARNDTKLFLSYVGETLIDFYSSFHSNYVMLLNGNFFPKSIGKYKITTGTNRKHIDGLVEDISMISTDRSKPMKEIIKNISEVWGKSFNSDVYDMYRHTPEKLRTRFDYFLMAYWLEKSQNKDIIDKNVKRSILMAFISSYRGIGVDIIKEVPTRPYQEIIDPDEVICIYGEKFFATDGNLQALINRFGVK